MHAIPVQAPPPRARDRRYRLARPPGAGRRQRRRLRQRRGGRRAARHSTSPISRSIRARAIAACTTAWSTISAIEQPQMLLCLHEESAVAIAHGYAKVTGKAMAAAVHSNVGLMHATMAIFNAWCDRMPMVDARRHRPGRRDQAAAVDRLDPHRARPGRAGARLHQMGRSAGLAGGRARSAAARQLDRQHRAARPDLRQSRRRDAGDEARRAGRPDRHPALHAGGRRARPAADEIAKAAELLRHAKHPVILAGRVSRSLDAWNARVALAEQLGARVVTDLKVGAAFPTDHPLHAGAPGGTVLRRRRPTPSAAPTSSSASIGSISPALSRSAAAMSAPRSCRSRSITACTTAGAWTIRGCRRSTC